MFLNEFEMMNGMVAAVGCPISTESPIRLRTPRANLSTS